MSKEYTPTNRTSEEVYESMQNSYLKYNKELPSEEEVVVMVDKIREELRNDRQKT